jgi:hypothetical protein
MESVKARLDQVAAIFRDAQQRAEPLLADLQPYLDAARQAERMGLSADSTPEQIIEAFAGRVDLALPTTQVVPSVLQAGDPQAIREAGESLIATHKAVGSLIGNVLGIIAGLA